jgi:DNA-directed RNA polymerase subunit RPC12/RpoP
MDLIFKCQHCEQELSVDSSGAGSEIECPSCGGKIVIPEPDKADATQPHLVNPISASAAAKEDRHFSVPQRTAAGETLIAKPLPPLEVSAKEGVQLRIKTFKRSDCVEVGKDHFDEVVSKFLEKIGESNIVSINPIAYSHQDLASRDWVTDFGVMIVFKG